MSYGGGDSGWVPGSSINSRARVEDKKRKAAASKPKTRSAASSSNSSGWVPGSSINSRAAREKEKKIQNAARARAKKIADFKRKKIADYKRSHSTSSESSGWIPGSSINSRAARISEKNKNKGNTVSRGGHGAAAPRGPMRDSGYGTKGEGTTGSGRRGGGGTFGGGSSKTWKPLKAKKFGMGMRAGSAPQGSRVAFNASLNPSTHRKAGKGEAAIHVAKGGDSWKTIASREGMSVSELKKANPWQMKNNKGVIYRNSKIYIPGKRKY